MPRKPKFIHPVRRLREIIGKSQPHFAALVGTSPETIKSIEIGRLQMSDNLAMRIAVATGVDDKSIKSQTGKPRSILLYGIPELDVSPWDVEFSKSDFDYWVSNPGPGEWSSKVCRDVATNVRSLFEAAIEKGKLNALLLYFDDWLSESAEQFGLKATATRIHKEKHRGDWGAFSLFGISMPKETGRPFWVYPGEELYDAVTKHLPQCDKPKRVKLPLSEPLKPSSPSARRSPGPKA